MDARGEMTATVARITRRKLAWRNPDVREVWERLAHLAAGTPRRRERAAKWLKYGGPLLLAGLGVGAWLILRPVPQPDYATARLDKVFNYTLLTDEFNRLPVEKRMELIGQLVKRLSSMSSGDSMMMAAFATGIAGAARKQIEENGSRLAIDLWDKYAQQYQAVKDEDRAAFLDGAFVEFVRMMEAIGGEPSSKSDSELLGEAREQAHRDEAAMRDGRRPPARAMGRAFLFMRENVGGHATPAQRSRGQQMMRDMVRHLRGDNLSTGR